MDDDRTSPRAIALEERRRWLQRVPPRKRLEAAGAEHRLRNLQDGFRSALGPNIAPDASARMETGPEPGAATEPASRGEESGGAVTAVTIVSEPSPVSIVLPVVASDPASSDPANRRLEGPGAALRLQSLQARFRRVGPRHKRQVRVTAGDLGEWFLIAAIGVVVGVSAAQFAIHIEKFGSFDLAWRHLAAAPNCDSARRFGVAPARRDEAGYWPDHDADNDGIACESAPGWK